MIIISWKEGIRQDGNRTWDCVICFTGLLTKIAFCRIIERGIACTEKKTMSRVVYEFHIKNYVVLKLDEMPKKAYRLFLIDGKKYSPVPIYDAKNCIAIESDESFLGKVIEFV